MRARLFALAAVVALALTLLVAAPQTHAAGGTGSISGVVLNGTHADAPVAGQRVTLQLTIGSTTKDIATTTTDAQGAFSFNKLDLSASSALGGSYAVYTTFQGGTYANGPINLTTNQTQTVKLMVYDATQDSANLSVSVATILVRQPDVTHGLIGIGEFITVRNSGMTAFVGSLPSSGAGATMPSLLRFSLPASAENVTTGVGFFNTTAVQIGSGFAAAATVAPGETEFAFAFDMPYTGTTLNVPYKAEYATGQVVTLVPPTMLVKSASGQTAQGIVTAFGSRYQVFTANTVAHDAQISINLYDLPQPGEPQDLNTTHLLWLGGGLLVLLALLLALYLWRGALAVALGLVPASPSGASLPMLAAPAASADRAAERDRLLRDVLALERRRSSGALTEEQFKLEDAALRGRLRALLAEEPTLAVVAAPPRATSEAAVAPGGGVR